MKVSKTPLKVPVYSVDPFLLRRTLMAVIEASLTYRPAGLDSDEPISLGSTDDPAVLRALRDRLLLAAKQEYLKWAGIEPGIAALWRADHQRLVSVFEVILPDEDLEPELQLVEEDIPDDVA
jgi:hypothetical protein